MNKLKILKFFISFVFLCISSHVTFAGNSFESQLNSSNRTLLMTFETNSLQFPKIDKNRLSWIHETYTFKYPQFLIIIPLDFGPLYAFEYKRILIRSLLGQCEGMINLNSIKSILIALRRAMDDGIGGCVTEDIVFFSGFTDIIHYFVPPVKSSSYYFFTFKVYCEKKQYTFHSETFQIKNVRMNLYLNDRLNCPKSYTGSVQNISSLRLKCYMDCKTRPPIIIGQTMISLTLNANDMNSKLTEFQNSTFNIVNDSHSYNLMRLPNASEAFIIAHESVQNVIPWVFSDISVCESTKLIDKIYAIGIVLREYISCGLVKRTYRVIDSAPFKPFDIPDTGISMYHDFFGYISSMNQSMSISKAFVTGLLHSFICRRYSKRNFRLNTMQINDSDADSQQLESEDCFGKTISKDTVFKDLCWITDYNDKIQLLESLMTWNGTMIVPPINIDSWEMDPKSNTNYTVDIHLPPIECPLHNISFFVVELHHSKNVGLDDFNRRYNLVFRSIVQLFHNINISSENDLVFRLSIFKNILKSPVIGGFFIRIYAISVDTISGVFITETRPFWIISASCDYIDPKYFSYQTYYKKYCHIPIFYDNFIWMPETPDSTFTDPSNIIDTYVRNGDINFDAFVGVKP